MNVNRETWAILAIAGVILIAFGTISLFANVSFATTSVGTYYYYVPGIGSVAYLSISTTSNTTQNFKLSTTWGTAGAKLEVIFPAGTTGNVTFRIANITENQLANFGASPLPAGLIGKAFFDIMLNITYSGTMPEVYLHVNVTNPNIRAYLWDSSSSSWKKVSGQTITYISSGIYDLKIPLEENLTGTPLTLATPAPVGGRLVIHTKTGHVAIALITIGLSLTGIASIFLVRKDREKKDR